MLMPCEVAVKSLDLALMSATTEELVQVHGLKREEAATLSSVTQIALSKYIRNVRVQPLTQKR